jgi:hypothetical protein
MTTAVGKICVDGACRQIGAVPLLMQVRALQVGKICVDNTPTSPDADTWTGTVTIWCSATAIQEPRSACVAGRGR